MRRYRYTPAPLRYCAKAHTAEGRPVLATYEVSLPDMSPVWYACGRHADEAQAQYPTAYIAPLPLPRAPRPTVGRCTHEDAPCCGC